MERYRFSCAGRRVIQNVLLSSSGGARHDVDAAAAAAAAPTSRDDNNNDDSRRGLTPVQRLRQAELSWLRSGQTTTLFSSETEKDPVSEARGGMASIYPPVLGACGSSPRVKTNALGGGEGERTGRQWQ